MQYKEIKTLNYLVKTDQLRLQSSHMSNPVWNQLSEPRLNSENSTHRASRLPHFSYGRPM